MPIITKLDSILAKKRMSLTELSEKTDITIANLSILKNGKAKAIRFPTLNAICKELKCKSRDILNFEPEKNN